MTRFPKYKEPIRLDIGSGSNPLKNGINIDIRDLGNNMVWDVTHGLPFPDDSVDAIFSSHFIEHLTDPQSLEFLRECLRVLQKGKTATIICPHVISPQSFYPGHFSFWNEARVFATERLEYPLPPFVLLKNERVENELHFTIQKI